MFRGIVIRSYAYGEADLVLRVISAETGKLSVIAKHARSSKRRFSGGLDLFDAGIFHTKAGRGSMPFLENFQAQGNYQSIRADLDKFNIASLVCECFDFLTHEGSEENSEVYDMLALTLEGVANSQDSKETLRAGFLGIATLLKHSGYLPTQDLPPPSANAMFRLLDQIEIVAERKILSREGLNLTIESLPK